MFEFGKIYTIRCYEADVNGKEGRVIEESGWEVVSVEMPLVKVMKGDAEAIINVASPNFIRAMRQT